MKKNVTFIPFFSSSNGNRKQTVLKWQFCLAFLLMLLSIPSVVSAQEVCPTPIINVTTGQICAGDPVVFSTPDLGFPCLEYAWSFGANASPSTAIGTGPHTVTFMTDGNRTVLVTIDNNCDAVPCDTNGDNGSSGDSESSSSGSSGSGSDDSSGSGSDSDPCDGSGTDSSGGSDSSGSGSGSSGSGSSGGSGGVSGPATICPSSMSNSSSGSNSSGSSGSSGGSSGSNSSGNSGSSAGSGSSGDANLNNNNCVPCRNTTMITVVVEDCQPNLGSIGDKVFNDLDRDGIQDANEPGVPNVTVQLKNCSNTVLQTTTTNGAGVYNFGSLDAGCYRIGIVLPNGFSVSPQNQGGNDNNDSDISPNNLMTGNINLAQGENDPSHDAGIFQDDPADPCNGIQVTISAGKVAINGLGGAPIVIAKVFNPDFSLAFECVNNCNDMEMVSGLPAGEYCVDVQFYTAQWSPICNYNECFDVPGGGGDDGTIGDKVFNDLDQDGVQDGNEPGVSGVTVQLKDCSNTVLQTTTTDGGGNYSFGSLAAGCYRIGIVLPSGFSVSPQNQGGNDNTDSDISPNSLMTGNINLGQGENDPSNDAGIFQDIQPNPGSIGDKVFNDLDQDGVQDGNEPGVSGVTVQLKDCSNTVLQTTTTDGGGNYSFGNLNAGCYRIGIVLPAGFSVSPQNQGGNDNTDSDISPNSLMTGNINLGQGENDTSVDAGIIGDDPTDPCDAIGVSTSAGKITVSGANAPIVLIKVFNSNWQTVFDCGNGECTNPQMISNLPEGDYCVSVKLFTPSWSPICDITECVTVPGGNDPCANQGGDNDNDGVCANNDCDDNDASVGAQQTPGTSCNDGNSNTINDVIQSDGCTCAGTPINDPCANQGGDNDNDGVCANNDCDDNDASVGAQQTPGTSCNDGNSNTTNDVIQSDGCTCLGTSTGGDPDCDDVVVTTGSGSITVSGLNAPIASVKIFNDSWQTVFECTNCDPSETVTDLNDGNYCVSIKYFTSSWSTICDRLECVFVGGGGGCNNLTDGGTIGFGSNCSNSSNLGTCPSDPSLIQNCESPSGGTGSIEYIWLRSTTSSSLPTTTIEDIVNDPHWSIISGATNSTYNPGSISSTTYYLRCSRRAGCDRYLGESNIIAAICSGGGSNVTISCPNNITVTQNQNGGAIVSWNTPTASSNCSSGGASVSQTTGPSNGSMFPVGSTIVAYTASDNCGGSATCSFTVTVNPNGGGNPPTGYCASSGSSPWTQWIKTVQMANLNNQSGKDGYGDFTHLGTNVSKGQSYTMTLEPGFSWTVYNENWRVWIDFNRDGDFEDAGEKVLEAQSSQTVVGNINIPSGAASGPTRMRVSMRNGGYAGPCMEFAEGEVEDYIVTIGNNFADEEVTFRNNETQNQDFTMYPNPTKGMVQVNLADFQKEAINLVVYNQLGQIVVKRSIDEVLTTNETLDLQNLSKGMYLVHVQAKDKAPIVKKLILTK